jgi:hypothetical protein
MNPQENEIRELSAEDAELKAQGYSEEEALRIKEMKRALAADPALRDRMARAVLSGAIPATPEQKALAEKLLVPATPNRAQRRALSGRNKKGQPRRV